MNETNPTNPEANRRAPMRALLFVLLIALSLAAGGVAWWAGWVRPETIQSLVSSKGAWSMVGYVAAVVIAELLWMPRMWGLLAGGVLFGPVVGGLLSLVGDTIAAILCYALARTAGHSWVAGMLERKPSAVKVMKLLAQRRGATTVAVLRVCPVAHYTLVSYAAGLAGVPLRSFLIGNTIGILPGAILYPIVGDAALQPTSPVFIGSLAILVVFLIATVMAGRRMLNS